MYGVLAKASKDPERPAIPGFMDNGRVRPVTISIYRVSTYSIYM